MFEKGEYIVYGHNGICEVEDITHLNLSGVDKGKLYYVLAPLNKKESRIYYPVDREKDGRARRTITRADAELLYPERGWIKTPRILSAGRACKAVCYLKPWLQGQQIWFPVIYGKISPRASM